MSQGTVRLKRHLEKLGKQRKVDMRAFRDYLKGKRVVFVGPAPNLVGQGLGEFIDNFDVIVRTGGAVPVAPELAPDYGSRTEVWYVNSVFLNRFDQTRIPEALSQGLKFACVRGLLAGERFFLNTPIYIRIFSAHVPEVKKPTIGVCLVNEILQGQTTELHITGVTFFAEGFKDSHLAGYLTDDLQTRENNLLKAKNGMVALGHDYHNGDKFIRDLHDQGKVTMSAETRGYLNVALERNKHCVGR